MLVVHVNLLTTVVHIFILDGSWNVEYLCEQWWHAHQFVPVLSKPIQYFAMSCSNPSKIAENGGKVGFVERVEDLILRMGQNDGGMVGEKVALRGEQRSSG